MTSTFCNSFGIKEDLIKNSVIIPVNFLTYDDAKNIMIQVNFFNNNEQQNNIKDFTEKQEIQQEEITENEELNLKEKQITTSYETNKNTTLTDSKTFTCSERFIIENSNNPFLLIMNEINNCLNNQNCKNTTFDGVEVTFIFSNEDNQTINSIADNYSNLILNFESEDHNIKNINDQLIEKLINQEISQMEFIDNVIINNKENIFISEKTNEVSINYTDCLELDIRSYKIFSGNGDLVAPELIEITKTKNCSTKADLLKLVIQNLEKINFITQNENYISFINSINENKNQILETTDVVNTEENDIIYNESVDEDNYSLNNSSIEQSTTINN